MVYAGAMSSAAIGHRSVTISERIEVVEDIRDSIEEDASAAAPELAPEERAELNRRLEAHRADSSSSIPWEKARAKLFRNPT